MAQLIDALRQRLSKLWRNHAVGPAPEWADLSLEEHTEQIMSEREEDPEVDD